MASVAVAMMPVPQWQWQEAAEQEPPAEAERVPDCVEMAELPGERWIAEGLVEVVRGQFENWLMKAAVWDLHTLERVFAFTEAMGDDLVAGFLAATMIPAPWKEEK